jgi:hypothetical protein
MIVESAIELMLSVHHRVNSMGCLTTAHKTEQWRGDVEIEPLEAIH